MGAFIGSFAVCRQWVSAVSFTLMLYDRWPQVRSGSHTNQSWYRNTVLPCITTNVPNMSTRRPILHLVVWTRHPWTSTTAWCNTISRVLKRFINLAPATNFYKTPSSTILCFDTASSSWKTSGERWTSAYCNTITSQPQCRPKIRQCLKPPKRNESCVRILRYRDQNTLVWPHYSS